MRTTTSKSLLKERGITMERSYSVYMHSKEGKVISVEIPNDLKTVSEAIELAITEFNREFNSDLGVDLKNYRLYAANNNGTRVKEYPSLDCEQQLNMVNVSQFYLRKNRHNLPKKITSSQQKKVHIASFYEYDKRPQLQVAKKEEGCLCFGI